jgi:hypothetical protein
VLFLFVSKEVWTKDSMSHLACNIRNILIALRNAMEWITTCCGCHPQRGTISYRCTERIARAYQVYQRSFAAVLSSNTVALLPASVARQANPFAPHFICLICLRGAEAGSAAVALGLGLYAKSD